MSSLTPTYDQHFPALLALPSASLRGSLSAGAIMAAGARRILERSGHLYTRSQRQRFHDMTRVSRMASADRSAFGVWLDLAPIASPAAAFWLLEMARVEVTGRADWRLPVPDVAHRDEEGTNHFGNLAQMEHRERRSRGTLEMLAEAMLAQSIASRVLADAEVAAMRNRSSLIVARR